MLRKPLVALGVIAVTGLAAFLGTEARAAPRRGAATFARAASRPQRQLPADAGGVSAFAFDPRDPNVVYVGTTPGEDNNQVYKSTDAGGHWRLVSGPGWKYLGALAVDPKHPETLYASTETGIHKTINGGRTWQTFTRGLLPLSGVARGEGFGRLAVDPNNSKIIYSGLGIGVRQSVNGGRTWQSIVGNRRRNFVLVAATRPTTIYAVWFSPPPTTGRPPYSPVLALGSSTDGGKTWQQTRLYAAMARDDSFATYDFAADPGSPTTVYAAFQARIFMSRDAGRSWRSIGEGLPQGRGVNATSLAVGAGTLYAAFGRHGIYESTDGGQTWTQSWPGPGSARGAGVSLVAIDPARPTTVYAAANYGTNSATGDHILRSTDSGRTWTVVG
jgi:photosystem II stability/assembly factor-like uncharacterized protein